MPRLRGSWVALAGVLWCATTFADTITVTTTDPALWNGNDSQCSLYEAVTYFNNEKPADGFQGCKKPKDDTSSDTIELPETKGSDVLTFQGTVEIQGTLTINGRGFNVNGTHTTLQAPASGPVFRTTGHWVCPASAVKSTSGTPPTCTTTTYIDRLTNDTCAEGVPDQKDGKNVCKVTTVTDATRATAALTLNQALLDGCGDTTTACTPGNGDQGAAFYVKEGVLTADHVVFFGGVTTGLGGAVYIANGASASFTSAIFRNNRAADGAAIYAANMRLTLRQSSLYDNAASAADGAIVRVAAGTTAAVAGSIENITFSRNGAGTALRLGASYVLNHLTIVDNNTGVGAIAAPGALVIDAGTLTLQNSIVAGNGAVECGGAGTWVRKYILVSVGSSCASLPGTTGDEPTTVTAVAFSSDGVGTPRLLADPDPSSASRFSSTLTALIDPANNGFKYHRPLMALQTWGDLAGSGYRAYSHVIDRGNFAGSSGSCGSTDQRGDARESCDLGAIEFKFSANKAVELTEHPTVDPLAAQKVYQGETVVISLAEAIGDAELMPDCASVGTTGLISSFDSNGDGGADGNVVGCPVIALAPAKGSIRIDANGNLVYTPSGSGFHGADTFVLRLYTTSSRFQDERHFVEVTYTVRADTHGGWQNSSLGGSVSWQWLLLGVLGLRRKKKN